MTLTDLFRDWSGYAEKDIPAPPQMLSQYLIFPVFHLLILDPWLLSNAGPGFSISSGYRDPLHNAEVGGVSDSAHEYGVGADVVGVDNRSQLAADWENDFGGWASAYSDGHLHVNLSRATAWKILRIEFFIVLLLLVVPVLIHSFKRGTR